MSQRRYTPKTEQRLAEAWKWLAGTAEGQLVIADIMVWGQVYTSIDGFHQRQRRFMSDTEIMMQIGENNFAKRIAGFLAWKPQEFPQQAEDDTDLLNRMMESMAGPDARVPH